MFTGLIEEVGTVGSVTAVGQGARLVIEAETVLADAEIGDSIAVNGCCLTVVELGDKTWAADAVPETLERTNLGALQAGDPVNLERPLAANGRFGGHIVQGHVDATVTVTSIDELADGSWRFGFALPAELAPSVVEKGSIAIDGISLTVASVDKSGFEIAVIPHTYEATNLGSCAIGDVVNVEVDILAKYVARMLKLDHE